MADTVDDEHALGRRLYQRGDVRVDAKIARVPALDPIDAEIGAVGHDGGKLKVRGVIRRERVRVVPAMQQISNALDAALSLLARQLLLARGEPRLQPREHRVE